MYKDHPKKKTNTTYDKHLQLGSLNGATKSLRICHKFLDKVSIQNLCINYELILKIFRLDHRNIFQS